MKLSVEKIREITTGAVRVFEKDGAVEFCRFTEEESEFYQRTNKAFYVKSTASSGVRLSFKTGSKMLFISAEMQTGCTRNYFSFDIFVDGRCVGYLDNIEGVEIPAYFSDMDRPLGEFSKSFSLGEGIKEVTVYLPWSTRTLIKEISVDDGAYVEAIKREKKLLAYGDSITQGYDALRPSNRYMSRVCDALGYEETNKAIGGEIFCAKLASFKNDTPDLITVAYGTNDWNRTTFDKFKVQSRGFFENLRNNYPDTKIFAITPIWRKDGTQEREFGDFSLATEYIYKAVEGLDVEVVYGYDLVPCDPALFGDLRLHPNDKGFEVYAENLLKKMNFKF